MFANANIARVERDGHTHVDSADSCLISSAALHRVHHLTRHGIYVGDGANGWMWAGPECSTLVLGPPRSGKTSSLVIPNILLSEGPVFSTSTKPDVMQATALARASEGWSFLYDPSGEVECPPGVERVGWSPLTTASDWDAAVVTAEAMVGASRLSGQRAGEHHWTERSGALLSTLLHAAATEELPMRDVLQWIDRHNGAPALEILASNAGGDAPATDLLAGIVATDSREQSGIWSTASGVLAAYRTKGALASTVAAPLDLEEFCGGANTLYVCSAGRRQRQFAPLVVAIMGDVRDAAYVRSRDGQSGPPTLLALDEVANIAPIPDLPAMVSEGAGQGLLVLACLQDLSQARVRWGHSGRRLPLALRHHRGPARHRRHGRRCATSARWRATGKWPPRRSAARWTAGAVSAPRRRSGAHARRAFRSTPWRTARPGAPSSSGRTRRCTRSRSPRRTRARPGVSSCRRHAGPAVPLTRRPRSLSQRPRPRSTVTVSRTRAGPGPSRPHARCGRDRPGAAPGGWPGSAARRAAPRRGPRPHLSR